MQGPLGHLSLIIKSIQKRPFRNIATILCFFVVTSCFLTIHFLVGGAQNSVQAGMDRIGADILVIPQQYVDVSEATLLMGKPTTFKFYGDVLSRIKTIEGVERVSPQIYIATLQNQGCCSTFLQLIAFDPESDFTIIPWLKTTLGRSLKKDECIIGAGIVGAPGNILTFYGHDFIIAGRLDPSGMGLDSSVFIRIEDAYVMSNESGWKAVRPAGIQQGEISAVLVRVEQGIDRESAATAIRTTIPGAYPYVTGSMARRVNAQLGGTTQVLYTITGAVTLVAFPFMALVSSLVANERRKELAILRAIGAKRRFIFMIVLAESLVLSLVGAIIGVICTSIVLVLFMPFIVTNLQVPFLWPSLGQLLSEVALIIVFAITLGGAAALYPAFQSSRQDPYEGIRKGDL